MADERNMRLAPVNLHHDLKVQFVIRARASTATDRPAESVTGSVCLRPSPLCVVAGDLLENAETRDGSERTQRGSVRTVCGRTSVLTTGEEAWTSF